MDFDTSTPRAHRTIAGQIVSVIQPFAEGQPLTAATAAMLNQTLAENFSNNLRKRIADALASDPATDVQAITDAYMTEYQPGVRSSSGGTPRVTDPVEREARKLARARINELLKAKGLKAKDVNMDELVTSLYEANEAAFRKQAEGIVKAQAKAAAGTEEIDLGDFGLAA